MSSSWPLRSRFASRQLHIPKGFEPSRTARRARSLRFIPSRNAVASSRGKSRGGMRRYNPADSSGLVFAAIYYSLPEKQKSRGKSPRPKLVWGFFTWLSALQPFQG
jgi:hypothetical protein